jgi:hypothetical protein
MLQATELSASPSFGEQCQRWVETPTLFVTRYEYANPYHTMGDWYNSFQDQQIFGTRPP